MFNPNRLRRVNSQFQSIFNYPQVIVWRQSSKRYELKDLLEFTTETHSDLKDVTQPPPFSVPPNLLILNFGEKSYCSTASCVPESK